MKDTNTMLKQTIAEQKKEIIRLQKFIARIEVKHQSEIAKLKAQLAEEKKNKIKVVVSRFDDQCP